MPKVGLEPTRRRHTPLKRTCLPIPPLRQRRDFLSYRFLKFKKKLYNLILKIHLQNKTT